MNPEKVGRPLRHQLTKRIAVTQCATCHNGGSRAAMNFRGLMEAPVPVRNLVGANDPIVRRIHATVRTAISDGTDLWATIRRARRG